MTLKGNYSGETSYSVGDVVLFTDGVSYHLQHPCPAGTSPVNTLYWSRTSQEINDIVSIAMDAIAMADSNDLTLANNLTTDTTGKALDATQGKALKEMIPTNISENAILLNSSSEGSSKQFLITVDDEGDITATEVETEEESET